MITVHRYIPGYPYLDDDEFLEVQVQTIDEIFVLDFVKSFKASPDFEMWMKSKNGALLYAKMGFRKQPLIVAVLPHNELVSHRMITHSFTIK